MYIFQNFVKKYCRTVKIRQRSEDKDSPLQDMLTRIIQHIMK